MVHIMHKAANTENCSAMRMQDVLQQLQHDLPQHSSSFAPHPDLPVAILLKGSGPNYIERAAAGGKHGQLYQVDHSNHICEPCCNLAVWVIGTQ